MALEDQNVEMPVRSGAGLRGNETSDTTAGRLGFGGTVRFCLLRAEEHQSHIRRPATLCNGLCIWACSVGLGMAREEIDPTFSPRVLTLRPSRRAEGSRRRTDFAPGNDNLPISPAPLT